MSSQYVNLPVTGGGGVTSLNSETGVINLVAGTGISVTPSGQNITIAATGAGTGTVTSVSVVSANGLAGTVANATTTPAITLSTSITGVLKGDGTSISAQTTGNITEATSSVLTISSGTGAVLGSGTTVQVKQASTSQSGYLSNTDWNTFNGKQAALTIGNLTDAGTDGIVVTGGIGSVIGSGTSLAQHVSDSTHNGYLSSADWAIFNGKQASGSYITALTSDVTASGPGSAAATIAVGAVTDTKSSLANKPSSTVVATSNQTLSGTPVIDGQATASGSIILLTAQTSGSENGPWMAAAGAWSRPTWYPSAGTTQAFQFITTLIRLGTTYQGSTWRMTTSGAITIDTTATTWVVTPVSLNSSTLTGIVPTANGGSGSSSNNVMVSSFGITIDGGGSAITTGVKGYLSIPYGCTINSVTMLADVSGSIVVDIWKIAYASFPPLVANTITASALPTITSAVKSQDSTLTGWTTAVTAGDTIAFNVNSATTITRLNLILKVTKT